MHAALDLGLVGVGLVGACLGFLWWNAAPARIIMGDTGSLAIGTGLGALCLLMNLDLLLPVIGGLFVAETASVIMQVISFRLFGRRIFRIAPFHHHLEMHDWPEFTIIVRLWIVAGLLAIREAGGTTFAQEPNEAQCSEMPISALDARAVDYCLPIKGIAAKLSELTA